MTTSGTATWSIDVVDIIEEAFERAGVELRSGYDMRTARRSLNILTLEWGNRGLNLWTIDQETQVLTAGTGNYTLPADTIDVLDAAIRTGTGVTQIDYYINRISSTTYLQIPTKTNQGRPLEYWVQRLTDAPVIQLWPVPDSAMTYTLYYTRMRRIQDTGSRASNTMDIPPRFVPAMVAGLAYYVAMKKPESMDRVPALKQIYDEQFELAAGEDREKASWNLAPWAGVP